MEEFGECDGEYYMAMEYMEGKDLNATTERLEGKGMRFYVAHALHIVAEVALALEHARRTLDRATGKPLGIVHGDVSPHNIMITYEGEVKIIDFGVARSEADINVTMVEMKMGKKGYMSPEQALGQDMDQRSDLFSLGVVLWELIAGEKMFSELSRLEYLKKIEGFRYPSLLEKNADATEELDQVVRKMLAFDPTDRFNTAGELYRELKKILHQGYPNFCQEDLREAMRSLYAQEMAEQRLRLQEYASEPIEETEVFEETRRQAKASMVSPRSESVVANNPMMARRGLWAELHAETKRLRRKAQTFVTLAWERARSDWTGVVTQASDGTSPLPSRASTVLDQSGSRDRKRRRRNRKIKRWIKFYYPVVLTVALASTVIYIGLKPTGPLQSDLHHEEIYDEVSDQIGFDDATGFSEQASEEAKPFPAGSNSPSTFVASPAQPTTNVAAPNRPTLAPAYTLKLMSRPSGAKIYENGSFTGRTTPAVLTYDSNKGRTYSFKKPGYTTVQKKIWPKIGAYEVRLKRAPKNDESGRTDILCGGGVFLKVKVLPKICV